MGTCDDAWGGGGEGGTNKSFWEREQKFNSQEGDKKYACFVLNICPPLTEILIAPESRKWKIFLTRTYIYNLQCLVAYHPDYRGHRILDTAICSSGLCRMH